MAILQSLLALLSRSLGRLVSSLFGWAVVALFGETSRTEKMWLSGLVGAAAAWPLLIIGVIWPRLATLVLAFVPLPQSISSTVIRIVWIGLAVAVPFALGLAVAIRARAAAAPIPGTGPQSGPGEAQFSDRKPSSLDESRLVRLARGVPITLAVAAAFLVVFATVPISRLMNMLRRRVELHVPLVTDARGYHQVAEEVASTLTEHGMELTRATPGWPLTAPARILLRLGGPSFREYVPAQLAYFRGPRLEAALYPNALTLTGSSRDTAWAHGLVVEALTTAPAYQTFDPEAQDIERQIRSVWAVLCENPAAHVGSPRLLARVDEIAGDIRNLPVDYDEWQIVYRQALQLARALTGRAQLLEGQGSEGEAKQNGQEAFVMTNYEDDDWRRTLSTGTLIREIIDGATALARKEVELVTTEVRADFYSELAMAKALGIAALLALLGLNALVVALVIGLAALMPAWLAAVAVGVVFLVAGGALGYWSWTRRVTDPLALTRKQLRQTAQWAKERFA